MADRIVINTGPLIALASADRLALLEDLPWDFICPPEVRAELDGGAARGLPPIIPRGLLVEPLREQLHPISLVTLDRGEAAVIQLAQEQGIPRVCIDERKGRRVAQSVGLEVVGTLGILLRAKTLGVVSKVEPIIHRMTRNGYHYHRKVIERVLEIARE